MIFLFIFATFSASLLVKTVKSPLSLMVSPSWARFNALYQLWQEFAEQVELLFPELNVIVCAQTALENKEEPIEMAKARVILLID
ncbi:hypothetical protein GVX86_01910 [[Haemophilus] felis]|nr:hypothetical protein [[Haemophilus] felis]